DDGFPPRVVVLPLAIKVVAVACHTRALQHDAARPRWIELVVIADEFDIAGDRSWPWITGHRGRPINVGGGVRPVIHLKIGGDGFAHLYGDRLRYRGEATTFRRDPIRTRQNIDRLIFAACRKDHESHGLFLAAQID